MAITISDNATPGLGNTYDQTGDSQGTSNTKRFDEGLALAAAVEIADGDPHDYNIAARGRECTIIIDNNLDVALDVDIFMQPVSALAQYTTIYSADDVVAATTGLVTWSPYAGGTGGTTYHLQVAALASPAYRFIVRIQGASAASSGTVNIYAACS